jgi:hypothetical protein
MNGPAVTPPTVVALVSSVSAAGNAPTCPEYTTTADASVRASAWALARRTRLEIGVERKRDRRQDADDGDDDHHLDVREAARLLGCVFPVPELDHR